jgi:hypothetical protein
MFHLVIVGARIVNLTINQALGAVDLMLQSLVLDVSN